MYRYKDIKSVTWMIRNRYPRLLKHKLVHRHLTTLLNSNDVAFVCKMVTEQDIDVFDYIYFKYSHLFLCYSVVAAAAKNRSTVHPLKLILSRTQQDGGYAMWIAPEIARLICLWIQELPPNLPVMPHVTIQRHPIAIELQYYHFYLPIDVFKITFSESLGSTTNNLNEAQFVKCTYQYLSWLGYLLGNDEEEVPPLPSYHNQALFDNQKNQTVPSLSPTTHPSPVTHSNIEMIEYIESKLATYHSGQQRKKSGRVQDIPRKNEWVQGMIRATILEQREPELLLLLSDHRVRDNVDWVFTYYHDHGNKVYNSMIRREIKKAYPTTQFVTCIDEVDKDNNHFDQEYHQQDNTGYIERVINRAIQCGHLPFIKKIYLKAAQFNQFAKWLIKKIKSDRFEDNKSLKVEEMQTALEIALLYGHYQITDLILSQVPKDYIFSFDLLQVVAISGNLEFFRAMTKFVDIDYTDRQMEPTMISAVQSAHRIN
ncbi:hypothetical protein DFA_03820 [Cavenderia fasciculata]|uniref:Ankyrin repeat-containing protein n=1 Tax=Cavenderia fasciculata TaxID=261658 RepID=F4Q0H5_CACFS|nr:uncharacterized protein DFA_03820 [Cavenderia fasciculata]EGG18326.1 hypothetical protein DFA_03820 [Cavenderia fasciculata]|eukprot:XP_004366230.1 hypothetical protein DFA_03820 [Cavenderia fasciculata]